MPQMDAFTFIGQVTWFAMAFVFYFSVVGGIILPSINRSVKLRDKKLAYQSGMTDAVSSSVSDGYSSAIKSLQGILTMPQGGVSSALKSVRLKKPASVVSKSRSVKRLRSMLS